MFRGKLKQGTDYKVSYSDQPNVGTWTAKVEYINNYAGVPSDTLKWKITPRNFKCNNPLYDLTAKKKYIRVFTNGNSKDGYLYVKKGIKRGSYTVRVKVKDVGTGNYKAKVQTVAIRVVVK